MQQRQGQSDLRTAATTRATTTTAALVDWLDRLLLLQEDQQAMQTFGAVSEALQRRQPLLRPRRLGDRSVLAKRELSMRCPQTKPLALEGRIVEQIVGQIVERIVERQVRRTGARTSVFEWNRMGIVLRQRRLRTVLLKQLLPTEDRVLPAASAGIKCYRGMHLLP